MSENAVGFQQTIGVAVLRCNSTEVGSELSFSKLAPEPFSIDRKERLTAEFLVTRAEKLPIMVSQFSGLAGFPEPRNSEVAEQFPRVYLSVFWHQAIEKSLGADEPSGIGRCIDKAESWQSVKQIPIAT